jgi:hypothetical protein
MATATWSSKNVLPTKSGTQVWLQVMVQAAIRIRLSQKTEGVLRIKDVTLPVVKSKTLQRLADDEYDYLGIVDPVRSMLTLNFVNQGFAGPSDQQVSIWKVKRWI